MNKEYKKRWQEVIEALQTNDLIELQKMIDKELARHS